MASRKPTSMASKGASAPVQPPELMAGAVVQSTVVQATSTTRSIPSPEDLERMNALVPDSAQRFIDTFIKRNDHAMDIDRQVLRATEWGNIRNDAIRLIALLIGGGIVGGALYAAFLLQSATALGTIAAVAGGVFSVARALDVYGDRKRKPSNDDEDG
jgi:uncharacterized membrane protein